MVSAMAWLELFVTMAMHSLQMHWPQLKILRTAFPSVVQGGLKPRPLVECSVQR